MADTVMPGPVDASACIREAVCIHTRKIFDSCKEKDLPFYIFFTCATALCSAYFPYTLLRGAACPSALS